MEPVFLTRGAVEALHRRAIERFGGTHGLRDEAALDAAVMQPRASFANEPLYAFPFGMAAAYALGLAMNHPFLDGNNRIAAISLGVFLELNGYRLVCSDDDLAGAILDLITGRLTRSDLEAWLPGQIAPIHR